MTSEDIQDLIAIYKGKHSAITKQRYYLDMEDKKNFEEFLEGLKKIQCADSLAIDKQEC